MRCFHLCAHEQFPPDQLLRQAKAAEAAGFDGIGCSDHLQPWWEPGEPSQARVWLGAAGAATGHQLGTDAVVQLAGEGDLAERFREAVGGGYEVVIDPLWGGPAVAALARHALAGEIQVPVHERALEEVAAAWEEQAGSPHDELVLRPR